MPAGPAGCGPCQRVGGPLRLRLDHTREGEREGGEGEGGGGSRLIQKLGDCNTERYQDMNVAKFERNQVWSLFNISSERHVLPVVMSGVAESV